MEVVAVLAASYMTITAASAHNNRLLRIGLLMNLYRLIVAVWHKLRFVIGENRLVIDILADQRIGIQLQTVDTVFVAIDKDNLFLRRTFAQKRL